MYNKNSSIRNVGGKEAFGHSFYHTLYNSVHFVLNKLLRQPSFLQLINKIVRHRTYITSLMKRYILYYLAVKVIYVKKISFVYVRMYFCIHVFQGRAIIIKGNNLSASFHLSQISIIASLITYCCFCISSHINLIYIE